MIKLTLFALLGLFCNVAWAQAAGDVLTATGPEEIDALVGVAKHLGPYGTLVVLFFVMQRVKLPAVPFKIEGPVTLRIDGEAGPVLLKLSGSLEGCDPEQRLRV